jgi:hypothetical protein
VRRIEMSVPSRRGWWHEPYRKAEATRASAEVVEGRAQTKENASPTTCRFIPAHPVLLFLVLLVVQPALPVAFRAISLI